MSKRTMFISLLTVLWFLLCHYRYTCIHKQACWGCKADVTAISPVKTSYMAMAFLAGSDSLITNENLTFAKDSILSLKTEDNLLEIVGYYRAGETAPEGFENMGLARAKQLKDQFANDIPGERIRIIGQQVSGELPEGLFASADFNWRIIDVEKAEVIQTANGATILFPSNVATKEANPAIDDALKIMAERVKLSNEKIILIGHTDNRGEPAANIQLGMRRANSIKSILNSYGVPDSQINVSSKGETQPVATNDTPEGQHQNRRVELKIE